MNAIHPKLILAVDDETDLCVLTKEFLERSGNFEVDVAGSVSEARVAIAQRCYDAIVSDYQMPGEDGIQFLKSLRASGNMIPFILFTGKGREEVVIEAINNGADAYLQKGGEPRSLFAELEHRIGTIVRRHRAETALLDSESEFRTLFENNPDAVVLVSIDGKVLNTNLAGAGMVLMSKEEIIGSSISDMGVFSEHDVARFQRTMIAMAKGEPVAPVVSQVRRKDGTVKWVEIRASIVTKAGLCVAFQIIGRDVTRQKRAEEALRNSESKFRAIFNGAAIGITTVSVDGKPLEFNDELANYLGYSREELGQRSFLEVTFPDDLEKDLAQYENLIAGKIDHYEMEKRYVRKDGKIVWALLSVSLVESNEGEPPLVLSIVTDITRLKMTEEALKESEQKYHTFFTTSRDCVFITTVDGKWVDFNDAAIELFGYKSREDLLKTDIPFLYAIPSDRDAHLRYIHEREFSFEYPVDLKKKDGTKINTLITTVARKDSYGNTISFQGSIRDITARKQAEKALHESEERLALALMGGNLGVWDLDLSTMKIIVNDRSIELIGKNRMDGPMDFEDWLSNLHPDDRKKVSDGISFESDQHTDLFEALLRFRHADGEYRYILDRGKVIQWDDRKRPRRVVGTLLDITELKKMEEAMETANRKLNLLSGITRHDVTNQLMVLTGNLTFLDGMQNGHSSEQHLRNAEAAAERISDMIRFTKDYEEVGVHAPIWQDVRTLVSAASKDLQLEKVKVVNGVPAGLEVFADPLIVKVFRNLIQNTLRHGGSVTTIHFYHEEQDGVRFLVCEDDGVGISADMKRKLFTKGFGKDHGLGLYLSREILSITGIVITEEGESGKGAKFVMTMPHNGLREN
ncbi:MAG: PAS domain S-box protein [Methanomassiliicoccales archaeon]